MFNGADVLARRTTQTTVPNMPSIFPFCEHAPNSDQIVVRHRRTSSCDDLRFDDDHQQPRECPSSSSSLSSSFGSFAASAPVPTGAAAAKQPPQSPEKVRTKLMSVWNNVRYGWTMRKKANFSDEEAIWLLGVMYHRKIQTKSSTPLWSCTSSMSSQKSWTPMTLSSRPIWGQSEPAAAADEDDGRLASYELFLEDFSSRLWFTYRREFSPIPGTDITSDCGWGCMLRSSQMMLAQALMTHVLGRNWRYRRNRQTEASDYMHRTIVRWFGDRTADASPFSLHKLVQMGHESGKQAGDWYGPSSAAYILKEALEGACQTERLLWDLRIYVAQDCTIYLEDVRALCRGTRPDGTPLWRSPIVLVPVRLGGEHLNATYIPCVKGMLSHPNCIGVIGGRPRHSLYFLGWQGEKVVYLDPHYVQEAVDVGKQDFPLDSFHCSWPRKMSFYKMDPSCTMGFYCKTEEEFERFVKDVKLLAVPMESRHEYPVFLVSEGSCVDHTDTSETDGPDFAHFLQDLRENTDRSHSEEYIIL
ncbi:autophagy-related 4b [Dermacentor variabilis]|uniref:autophagy-related 4b n=1 Tax=Dermacentor variabilis TaxID=34621 RepID=UPI003F5B48A9